MSNLHKNQLSGFFEDSNGNKSSTRLKTFLAAITAFVIALATVFVSSISLVESIPVIITLLAFSAGEKSFQYFIDSKYKINNHE
ncbi:MAG: hypothetical protein QM503_08195 [Bacteroidota bacterium]